MHITKLELNNIKSYEEAFFEFERGTTAIVGENGAGKTTLIEAIAWVVFDMLDYKKDDFLRRGAKTGRVSVEFESSLDERRYIVERDTRTSYYVYDPRSKTRIAEKKDEVTRFVWQHLGVEPGTDLESLFRRAIGVPQGTFTSIFLEPPGERKKAFEKLLKVEEYRLGASRLGKTSRHIEMLTNETNQKIARAEGVLTKKEDLAKEKTELEVSTKSAEIELENLKKTVEEAEASLLVLTQKKKEFETATKTLESLHSKENNLTRLIERLENDLENSQKAAVAVEENKQGFETFQRSVEDIKRLQTKIGERKNSQQRKTEVEKQKLKLDAQLSALQKQEKEFNEKKSKLEELAPMAQKQNVIEQKISGLEKQIASLEVDSKRFIVVKESLEKLRGRYQNNEKALSQLSELKPLAEKLPKIRGAEQRITREAEKLRARLESDREFRSQIKDGMCPIFRDACRNLKDGQTLDGFLNEKFESIENKLTDLKSEEQGLRKEFEEATKAKDKTAGIPTLEKRKAEITEDGKKLRAEKESLEKRLADESQLRKDLQTNKKELSDLNDPGATERILRKDLDRLRIGLDEMSAKTEHLKQLDGELQKLDKTIEAFGDLDGEQAKLTKLRDENESNYKNYLKNESLASRLEKTKQELETTKKELADVVSEKQKSESSMKTLSDGFDLERYEKESNALQTNKASLVRQETEQKHRLSRLSSIERDFEALKETEENLKLDRKEKERLESLSASVKFIRTTLQQAAPQVAKNYVYHVSVEANRFFREISGEVESTLRWTDDYAIELEEQGFTRPFVSLSGGEQMSAALAVRLSLLRQLSDVRIAFFDEPTTNMDVERRERLAEQISRITESQTFDQMFVISHDDTFENYVDHVIEVGE